ncbi:NAD(+) diphosphatase [Thermomonas brevis]|uniref:NAD(+) diphosphatase n=1 Tax=Thermomonas brevis TaxID=215691 RepID=A0A7G9QWT4_9GAMM|nr:NAD(+) diphosphatase [Thermomonas brevis]QNN47809.1 NAD(+) diphosphatase [Thermomonas brevis]
MVSPFSFVDGALDRADHLRDDPAALAAAWPSAGVIALDAAGNALADAASQLLPLDGAALADGPGAAVFLGQREGRAWFFVDADAPGVDAPARIDLRRAASRWPAWQATLFAQARAVQHWHQRHRYCAACGGALRFVRAGWLGTCDACGSEHYPRTDQAIIAAITDGERLLLGRQSGWPARRWSVVAGFVEPGETLEQTVAREVMEETGVRVHVDSARYLASQPWPFPGSLMLGFIARAEPDAPQASEELEDARWFGADEVRAGLERDWRDADAAGEGIVLSSPISIARHVIRAWLDEYDAAQRSQ